MTPTDAPNSVTECFNRAFFGRSVAWLFSPKHFHFKLLSGTAVGIVVITFLAGPFLLSPVNHHQESLRAQSTYIQRCASPVSSKTNRGASKPVTAASAYPVTSSYVEPFERRRELIKRRVDY